MIDTPKHQGMRAKLVALLKQKGIEDAAVLQAINNLPRHLFLDSSFEDHAYQDKAFPIGANQTISQPYTVAFQTQLLHLKKGDKVLEIGTGSGYQTAILILMGAHVYSIERQHTLFRSTMRNLSKMNFHAKKLAYGDGYKGMPDEAPFDKILVTAGAPSVPHDLLAQLKIGGRMVIPVGAGVQKMTLFIRQSDTVFDKEVLGDFRFVPMLGEKN